MLAQLCASPDPIIRYKALTFILGKDPLSPEVKEIQAEIPASPRVQLLLSDRDTSGKIPFHPYTKWQGAHWVLTCLADIGYPPGDPSLLPLRDQVYAWLFAEDHIQEIHDRTGLNRQVRMHASMEGNALFASLVLGLENGRTEGLVERLLWAQWDDGGWNCDRHKEADTSSFFETLTPMRALTKYAALSGDRRGRASVERAAEIFLSRRLFKRRRDGEVMRADFLKLRYPCYWYYDILFGLKVMTEAGLINDPRCQEALDVLESKQLPGGGFAAEGKHFVVFRKPGTFLHTGSRTDWGIVHRQKANEYITVDALAILHAAGRFKIPKDMQEKVKSQKKGKT